MAVTRRGGDLSNTDSVTVRRVTIPSNTVAGDIGIIAITYYQADTGAAALAIPGWARIGERAIEDWRSAVYYKSLGVADRGTEVEVTFGTAQRAPMALEVWGGLQGAPISDWNTHTTATITHLIDSVGSSGQYQPFAVFGTRAGPTPPTEATPSAGYTQRQFGVRASTYSGVVAIATRAAGAAPVGGGTFTTVDPYTSVTWALAFAVKPERQSLQVQSLGITSLEPMVSRVRLHQASITASVTPYSVRRNGVWVPIDLFIRRGSTWK